ncbi:MAG TPA: L-lactate permease [Candidatus Limnocylindria bacterium]|nr:L-lactate permease [Candidatus Limnocylindria bacterium]
MPELPVEPLNWALALLPLVVLLILLAGLHWKAPEAGPIGLFIAAGVAIIAFETPLEVLAVASGKGVWDAIFILYVIWPALLLYRVVDRAGAFEALHAGIERFSRNELFLVLAFGWVFVSFLQGITGFGVPIAVVAPLLIGLGVRPLYAVVIPLIGHAWANLFGTLAVAWLATERVVSLEDQTATLIQSGLLLWIPNLLAGLAICWLFGRMKGVAAGLPLVLIVSALHGGVQLGMVLISPVLAGFTAGAVALIALYPLSRWQRYSEPNEEISQRPVMDEKRFAEEEAPEPVMGLGMALMPYLVLTALTVGALIYPPVEEALAQFQIGPSFPAVEAGFGQEVEAEEPYSPFAPLTHPGTFLLVAAGVAWLIYRLRGAYRRWAEVAEPTPVLRGVVGDGLPASVAVAAFLVMSVIMDDSGQTDVLALGIAEVAPPIVFAFLAGAIGMVGSFMTSSNTASNILFAPLQDQAAGALELNQSTVISAQNAGGALGNSVSPANVVLGTGTAGIVGQEGRILRMVLPWAGIALVFLGAATVALQLFWPE